MGQVNSARSNGSTKSAYAGGKPFYALVSNNHHFFLCVYIRIGHYDVI